ncbi:MAG: hypothetical protein PHF56_10070 [Desulfuromonadaceae bacterium]|nr:hypothetical protein [Desulfuromonadaceae bacterium]
MGSDNVHGHLKNLKTSTESLYTYPATLFQILKKITGLFTRLSAVQSSLFHLMKGKFVLISVNQAVIFAMRSYPEPDYSIRDGDSESAVMKADANRPKLSGLFKMKRRVSGVQFQQGKIGVGQLLN